jgi:tetratricopeptide (TPR) repeat protein
LFDKVLAIDPKNIDTLINKGIALAALQKYNEAVKYYDKVLAINPNATSAIDGKRLSLEDTK